MPVTFTILSTIVTLHVAVFLPLSAVTVMVDSPGSMAVTNPVSSIDATSGALELQIWPLLGVSIGVKVATNLSVLPFAKINSFLFSSIVGIVSKLSSVLPQPTTNTKIRVIDIFFIFGEFSQVSFLKTSSNLVCSFYV